MQTISCMVQIEKQKVELVICCVIILFSKKKNIDIDVIIVIIKCFLLYLILIYSPSIFNNNKHLIFSAPYDALVVKASGLAAGKGVVVANDQEEACAAVDEILGDKKYGSAGNTIVVEEKLTGEEISVSRFHFSRIGVMVTNTDLFLDRYWRSLITTQ